MTKIDDELYCYSNEFNSHLPFDTLCFSIEVLLPLGEKILRTALNICEVERHLLWHKLEVGMFGMRNFRYRYTEKIIPILSVYRFSFDNYKGKFFNGSLKEILSNSKRENDNFEAVSNDMHVLSVKSH